MTHTTHIRDGNGDSLCETPVTGARESISLQHWQRARTAPDWMGLLTLPVPMCDVCRWRADVQPPAAWPHAPGVGGPVVARWLMGEDR